MYGPVKLVDAVSRLTDLYSKTNLLKTDQFLMRAEEKIDKNKYTVMASSEDFIKFMDDLIYEFTNELKKDTEEKVNRRIVGAAGIEIGKYHRWLRRRKNCGEE
jgi:hypothetical protein